MIKNIPVLSAPLALQHVIKSEEYMEFNNFPNKVELEGKRTAIDAGREFFEASTDEARLRTASEYSYAILHKAGMPSAVYFRRAVMRRELGRDIDYDKHRDHEAHTLNNYLLGWYIYLNSKVMKKALNDAFEYRLQKIPNVTVKVYESKKEGIKNMSLHYLLRPHFYFGRIWPIVSLLHDIGYLFEGNQEVLDTETQNQRVSRGASVAHDFFHHRFWFDLELDVDTAGSLLRRLELTIPEFQRGSVISTADRLVSLGRLGMITDLMSVDATKYNIKKIDYLPMDAFSLWDKYYKEHDNNSMRKRLKDFRNAFRLMVIRGLGSNGLRMIDHGIASGLLVLLYWTFFHQIYFAFNKLSTSLSKKSERDLREATANFTESTMKARRFGISPWNWWAVGVWGTAACAIHNLQQLKVEEWPVDDTHLLDKHNTDDNNSHGIKMKLQEDPLGFLGILVDILQEWDRYSVKSKSPFEGAISLQGKDVRISVENDCVIIDYGQQKKADDVRTALNRALDEENWKKIVSILPPENKVNKHNKHKIKKS